VTSRKMQQGAAAMQGDEAKLGGTGPVGLRQPSAICCEFRAASRGIAINSRFSLVERRSPCLVQHAPSECSNTRWCCYANRAEEIESANRGARIAYGQCDDERRRSAPTIRRKLFRCIFLIMRVAVALLLLDYFQDLTRDIRVNINGANLALLNEHRKRISQPFDQ